MPKPRVWKLETATARRRWPVRENKKPHYITISPDIALGYRRNQGAGTWSIRCTGDGADWVKRLALADDPERSEITSYALRHSSICRALLKGIPVSIVARLHDTSSREIEADYAAYILDVAGDALSRKALLQPQPPAAANVILLRG
jgi:hypothetical protein